MYYKPGTKRTSQVGLHFVHKRGDMCDVTTHDKVDELNIHYWCWQTMIRVHYAGTFVT